MRKQPRAKRPYFSRMEERYVGIRTQGKTLPIQPESGAAYPGRQGKPASRQVLGKLSAIPKRQKRFQEGLKKRGRAHKGQFTARKWKKPWGSEHRRGTRLCRKKGGRNSRGSLSNVNVEKAGEKKPTPGFPRNVILPLNKEGGVGVLL